MQSSRRLLCQIVEQGDNIAPTSSLAKAIWKSSVRSVRVPSVWDNYSKQVVAQSPFLTPRDVATIVHSFARVKYRDDKVLSSIIPLILRNLNEFTAREIVHILSAFRKLEYSRLDCMDILVNQLVLNYRDWNAIDCALIANSMAFFRIFDNQIWNSIQKYFLQHADEFTPLGFGLVLGALAKLDMRNEHILRKTSKCILSGPGGVMKQESFAIIMHAFYKLRWDKDFMLNEFLIDQFKFFLDQNFFDQQSICMGLHALFCYRLGEEQLSPEHSQLLSEGISKLLADPEWKPSLDQEKRLHDIVSLYKGCPEVKVLEDFLRKCCPAESHSRKGHKLPRWEYEIFRIMKDKMQAPVQRRVRNGRTDIILHSDGKQLYVLCLGPFQFYADSTKRTASSLLLQRIIQREGCGVMEIPFYIWNELKTDEDKIMYLYSLGRRVHAGSDTND